MKARGELRLAFSDVDEAHRMAASIRPENGPHLAARVEGADLVAHAEAASPLALLHTLDDALACLGAAQRAARLGKEPR